MCGAIISGYGTSPVMALLRRYGAELACPVYVRKRKFETELVVLKRRGGSAHYAPTSSRSQVPVQTGGLCHVVGVQLR
jgi:hypothetical protein